MKKKMVKGKSELLWQDLEVKFDEKSEFLEVDGGEYLIDIMPSVEDTKGNNGESGELKITNLRLIWICAKNKGINLSIGYSMVISIKVNSIDSVLRGKTEALFILTKVKDTRFEFVFTNLVSSNHRLFVTIQVTRTLAKHGSFDVIH